MTATCGIQSKFEQLVIKELLEKLQINPVPQEGFVLSRKKGFMSDELKYALAEELGVADIARNDGWGSVSSRDCGRLVQKAIEMAERQMLQQQSVELEQLR